MPLKKRNDPTCQIGPTERSLDLVRDAMTTPDEALSIADLFKLLGEPTRLRVLSALVEAGELSVGAIAEVVDASDQKVSQGLRLLRSAGLVANRRAGRSIFYRVSNEQVRHLVDLSLDHTTILEEQSPHVGTVQRISYTPQSRDPLVIADEVEVAVGTGISGDRPGENSARQVSIQSRSELDIAEKRLGRSIHADDTRRNITLDAGELPRARGQRLLVGTVELEVFSDAPPCDRMTEIIGSGARAALRKLGGIHCRVIREGVIHLGDDLHLGRGPAKSG